MDVSTQGLLVRLLAESFHGDRAAADAMAFLKVVERHFTSGVEVRFPLENIRLLANVVRLIVPPKPGGDLCLGCQFVRPLTPQEAAKILRVAAPEPSDAPLPFEAASKAALRLWVYDPTAGEAGGPIAVLDLLATGPEALEGRVTTPAGVTCEEAHTLLDVGAMPARIQGPRAALWEGPVRVLSTREEGGATPEVHARFAALQPVGDALAKHVRARRA